MAQDFSVVLASPVIDLGFALGAISTSLEAIGLRYEPVVTRLEPDGGEEDDTISLESFESGEATDWNGCTMTFSAPGLTLDVVMSRRDASFLNVYVDESANAFRRGYRDGTISLYFSTLVEIARACQAVGGLGSFVAPPDPIEPSEIVHAILNNPENPGFPADIGLLRIADMPREVVEELTTGKFRIIEMPDYWLLVSHGLLELLRDLEGESAWLKTV